MRPAGKWDTNAPREVCERCHTSSLHSRWQTSPTLLGATARSCREQCRQTRAGSQIVAPRDKVRTWHDSFEARARYTSSLRSGCLLLPPHLLSCRSYMGDGSLAGWLLGVPAGNTYYHDVSIVQEKTGNLASFP